MGKPESDYIFTTSKKQNHICSFLFYLHQGGQSSFIIVCSLFQQSVEMPILEIAPDESLVRQLVSEHWGTSVVALLFTYLAITLLWNEFWPGLRQIPGPIFAGFTRLFLVYHAAQGDGHTLYQDLHQKYGRMVRVGPQKVSISDPDVIPIIYNIGSKYEKVSLSLHDFHKCLLINIQSRFYDPFASTYKRRPLENLFATRDTEWHRRMKSTVASAYSFSSLRQFESMIDECSTMFTNAMNDMAGQPIDFGRWLQWYSFDVVGKITFSQDFGFLRNRKDTKNVIDGINAGTKVNTIISQIPELHPWLLGNDRLMNVLMAIPAVAKANPIVVLNKVCLGRRNR